MSVYFYIDGQRGVVFSKASGRFGRAEALIHMERLAQDPEFRPTMNQLSDFRGVEAVALSPGEVRELASRTVFSGSSRRAFLVSSDFQFALSRLFATYREFGGEKGIMVFKEMKEALDWLSLSEGPDAARFRCLDAADDDAGHP